MEAVLQYCCIALQRFWPIFNLRKMFSMTDNYTFNSEKFTTILVNSEHFTIDALFCYIIWY